MSEIMAEEIRQRKLHKLDNPTDEDIIREIEAERFADKVLPYMIGFAFGIFVARLCWDI